jgi:DNA-binding transcriptional regulator YiaG
LTEHRRIAYDQSMTGQVLRRRRTRLDYSQPQLARLLGVDPMTVSRWERGVHRIPVAVARLVTAMAPRAKKNRARKGGP